MDNNNIMVKKPLHKPALILGIVAIATFWFTFGISGLVCAIISLNLARKHKFEYNTTAGSVLSLIALILSALILVVLALRLLVVLIIPDSIGAYYIQDLFESIFGI